MKFRIKFEVTTDGVTANGVHLKFTRSIWPCDMRESSIPGAPRAYRRDLLAKSLKGEYGLKLPRGAVVGTKWEAVVEAPEGLWGDYGMLGFESDLSFEGDNPPGGFFIFVGEDAVPVCPKDEEKVA